MKSLVLLSILLSTKLVYAEEQIPAIKIEKLAEGVFLHKSYQMTKGWGLVSSNGLVILDDKNAYIIDTPWSESDTGELVSWIKKRGYKPAASISTHSHDDRSAGIAWLNSKSIPTYASKLTNELLLQEGKALATHSFDETEFWMVEDLIEAYYPGGGHTIDNIVV
ncbi:MAG: metallo-beta-lactamase, partial [Kangiellaceae bacterium]|nr:metallo-beta-lactamase [Kangiellaceae bacterium]